MKSKAILYTLLGFLAFLAITCVFIIVWVLATKVVVVQNLK